MSAALFSFMEEMMGRTLSEIQSLIEENDIKFIRLSFCDIFGVQKNIAIMANQLKQKKAKA